MDTEGSETDIVLDFPWQEFDIRIVQIEQLSEVRYKAQRGRKDQIIQHLQSFGYKLLSNFAVAPYDTDDLIFTRNVDEFLSKTLPHFRDGDYTNKQHSKKHGGILSIMQNIDGAAAGNVEQVSQADVVDTPLASRGQGGGGECQCSVPTKWTAQAGQDSYVWDRVLKAQNLCCQGIFVEFGALDGKMHSNTWAFERYQGWKGLLFEVDYRLAQSVQWNRPKADVVQGPVCPRQQQNVTILINKNIGWTGSELDYGEKTSVSVMRSSDANCPILTFSLRKLV